MKKTALICSVVLLSAIAFGSCGRKSEANKEQIENARQEAIEMTEGYDATKSMKPATGVPTSEKVTFDTTPVTDIIISEDPAQSN